MPASRYTPALSLSNGLLASSLRRYFYSGWAFLMPYLVAYLLYYVTKWPVNAAVVGGVGSQESGVSIANAAHPWVPCLLHVYWVFHAIHVILAGFALWSWWAHERAKGQASSVVDIAPKGHPQRQPSANATGEPLYAIRAAHHLRLSAPSPLLALAPWALLALIFYIPGVYLEWPSDPWEHLRRINEWRVLDTVGAHSSWTKSAYFIPYSLLSWCVGLRQLFWLDFYYTGICLLLCWQYYRFSRACGLGDRASMVFVIIQALLFGNNIFSFYRYYGISSSIYAQLGAIALTRIVLEFASRGTKLVGPSLVDAPSVIPGTDARSDPTQSLSPIAPHPSPIPDTPSAPGEESAPQLCGLNCPVGTQLPPPSATLRASRLTQAARLTISALPCSVNLFISVACLIALTAMNHPQGLGIAALGIIAIITWRLVEWKRSSLWWLIASAFIANALLLWLYPRPAIIETYRAERWLNGWYGFNLLSPSSPAFSRSMQVIGIYGVFSLVAGGLLLPKRRASAFLTIVPLLVVLMPVLTFAFLAGTCGEYHHDNVITFQRFLFSVPLFLSVVDLFQTFFFATRTSPSSAPAPLYTWLTARRSSVFAFAVLCTACTAALSFSPSGNSFNRFWQTISAEPPDLRLVGWASLQKVLKRTDFVTSRAEMVVEQSLTNPLGPVERSIGMPNSKYAVATLKKFPVTEHGKTDETPPRNPAAFERVYGELDVESSNRSCVLGAYNPNLPMNRWVTALDGTAPPDLEKEGSNIFIYNKPGTVSYPFTSALIPIRHDRCYSIEVKVREPSCIENKVYLALAWYDDQGRFLASNICDDTGAKDPAGWNNGTYSYFGLVGDQPPKDWTTYKVKFGIGQDFAIPEAARFFRPGGLLNFGGDSVGVVEMSLPEIKEVPSPAFRVYYSKPTSIYTFTSQAGALSTHWPAQEVPAMNAGAAEFISAGIRWSQAIHEPTTPH